MTEDDFWKHLEFRVCGEFLGFAEPHLQRLWCDGLNPVDYVLTGDAPHIAGTAWIGNGSRYQETWDFRLLVPCPITDRARFDWDLLLPHDDVTGWLAPDMASKTLIVVPAAAEPDD